MNDGDRYDMIRFDRRESEMLRDISALDIINRCQYEYEADELSEGHR